MPRTMVVRIPAGYLGFDRGGQGQTLACLDHYPLLVLKPVPPVLQPSIIVLALIHVDVKAPADGTEPLVFQSVELLHRYAADLRPGLVLKCVVIQKLASKKQGDRDHSPRLAGCIAGVARGCHHVDSFRKVVHPKQDGGAGQACRCQNLRHKLPESVVYG